MLTLCPVSPGFPGAPGTPGKPLELTKSKSQLLLAIMIIQYTHTKSALQKRTTFLAKKHLTLQ